MNLIYQEISMRELPAPRPAVNQHIDENNAMVISHNTIYQGGEQMKRRMGKVIVMTSQVFASIK